MCVGDEKVAVTTASRGAAMPHHPQNPNHCVTTALPPEVDCGLVLCVVCESFFVMRVLLFADFACVCAHEMRGSLEWKQTEQNVEIPGKHDQTVTTNRPKSLLQQTKTVLLTRTKLCLAVTLLATRLALLSGLHLHPSHTPPKHTLLTNYLKTAIHAMHAN